MKATSTLLGILFLSAGLPNLDAMELHPTTLKAWDDYIGKADARVQMRVSGQEPYLWSDETPGLSSVLQRGNTVVAPAIGNGIVTVPGGLIHHWMGAVFIPHSTLAELHAVVSDYDRYKDFFKPVVADSRTLPCSGGGRRFSMIWQRRVLFVHAAIEGQYLVHDFAVDARRGYYIANTTQVREIEGYGERGAHFLTPDQGSGFIWRMHSIARYEERDGGVYLELEAIALTRDIPASLRWLVSPVVNHLSINSLTATLRQTRVAVRAMATGPETVASLTGRRPGGAK